METLKTLTAFVALAPALMTSTLAMAEPPGRPSLYGVYDARNTFIGTLVYPGALYREYNNKPYIVSFRRDGFHDSILWLYTAAGCAGQGYIADDYPFAPKYALWERTTKTLWTADDTRTTLKGYSSYKWGGECFDTTEGYGPLNVALPKALEIGVQLKPDFTVR